MARNDPPVILCVDDEQSILSSLRRIFLDEPWELLFASSGPEGLKQIEGRSVDLVMSDFRMPGMDGVEFLRRVKERQPDSVRIVFSGYADINLVVNALNEGQIYRFISKPWNDEELLDNIRKALEHSRLDLENQFLTSELKQLNADLEQKVQERTRELIEKNRSLYFARIVLDLLPMPVLGVDQAGIVVFANAKARKFLGPDLVDRPAPDLFEPELTGAIARACRERDPTSYVMPMVIDGEPVGAIILAPEDDLASLESASAHDALRWTVSPV